MSDEDMVITAPKSALDTLVTLRSYIHTVIHIPHETFHIMPQYKKKVTTTLGNLLKF